LDALSGLTLALTSFPVASVIWVAILQCPCFHFDAGSGHEAQYQPVGYSWLREQPEQASTTTRQAPLLKEHPFAAIKGQSTPSRIVVHFIKKSPCGNDDRKIGWKIRISNPFHSLKFRTRNLSVIKSEVNPKY
jgi:hypothetical protein